YSITTTPCAPPNPISPANPLATLRELLTDKRPVDVSTLESTYVACPAHHLSYLTKSEFSALVSAASARPEFVLKLCEDQLLFVPFSLFGVGRNDTKPAIEETTSPAPIEHLTNAQAHYTKLAKNRMGVHHAYLERLLRIYEHISSTPTHSQVIGVLRGIISTVLQSLFSRPQFRFESHLSQVVWHAIASVQFDRAQTRAILGALRLRFSGTGSARDSRTCDSDPMQHLLQTILDSPKADTRIHNEVCSILRDSQAWSWLRALAGGPHEPSMVAGANTRLAVLVMLHQLYADTPLTGSKSRLHHSNIVGTPCPQTQSIEPFYRPFSALHAISVYTRRVGAERLLTVYTSVLCEEDKIHMAQPRSLSVELGAAYACTGTSNVFELSARLSAAGFRLDSIRLPSGYLTHVVDLLLKYRFVQVARKVSSQVPADLPPTLIASVAYNCAEAGYVSDAASLLCDARLDVEERHRIALECLYQLNKQRGRTPPNLRPIAVRMALNAGLLRLAGLMGAHWQLQPRLQRLLATRLVKARLPGSLPRHWTHTKISGRARRSHNRLSYGEINATRLGNILLSRSSARLGGRAQLRATLATLARLLRANGVAYETSWSSKRKRAPFRPDGVTLNIILRALVRSTFCVSSSDLRTLFDLLSRAGRCGMAKVGNHFGTGADYVLDGYASSAIALAKLVPRTEGPWAFVRYVRPLLRTFVAGLRIRGDQEGSRRNEGSQGRGLALEKGGLA
ncbi:hypothetical protein RHS01_06998, partial [Rhizoctonia solani]